MNPESLVLRGACEASCPAAPAHVSGCVAGPGRTAAAALRSSASPAPALRGASSLLPASVGTPSRTRGGLRGTGFVLALDRPVGVFPALLDPLLLRIHDLIDVLPPPEIVLQRDGALGRGDDVDALLLRAADTRGEFVRVRHGCRQQNERHVVG